MYTYFPAPVHYCQNESSIIHKEQLCNGYRDCDYGSDEFDCEWYTCHNGYMIDYFQACDSYEDCMEGEDELYCTV